MGIGYVKKETPISEKSEPKQIKKKDKLEYEGITFQQEKTKENILRLYRSNKLTYDAFKHLWNNFSYFQQGVQDIISAGIHKRQIPVLDYIPDKNITTLLKNYTNRIIHEELLPNYELFHSDFSFVTMYPELDKSQIEYVCDLIKQFYN